MRKKTLLSLMTYCLLINSFFVYGTEIPKNQEIKQSLNSGETIINGEVQATVVSITVPQAISFILNPNGTTPEERFISPTFSIENNSNAPLSVTIQSLRNKEDSPHKFTDVAPNKYTDEQWSKLNKAQSMNEIGLSIVPQNNNEWRDSKVEIFNAIDNNKIIGALNPHSRADMKLVAKHGNSFESLKSDYQVTFIFDLLNGRSGEEIPNTKETFYKLNISGTTKGVQMGELTFKDNEDNIIDYEIIGFNKPTLHNYNNNKLSSLNDNNKSTVFSFFDKTSSSYLSDDLYLKLDKKPAKIDIYVKNYIGNLNIGINHVIDSSKIIIDGDRVVYLDKYNSIGHFTVGYNDNSLDLNNH